MKINIFKMLIYKPLVDFLNKKYNNLKNLKNSIMIQKIKKITISINQQLKECYNLIVYHDLHILSHFY
jgi:hypothetical protein